MTTTFKVSVLQSVTRGQLNEPEFFAIMTTDALRSTFQLRAEALQRMHHELNSKNFCDFHFNNRPMFGLREIRIETCGYQPI